MVLVILAAICVAAFVVIFRSFERFQVPLLAGIAVNYFVAFLCGLALSPDRSALEVPGVLPSGLLLGVLFFSVFWLIGLSSQRAGVARTTVAARMSLVLTVVSSALLFHERISAPAWFGIALSLAGLALATAKQSNTGGDRAWLLPLIIFVGSAVCDMTVAVAQHWFVPDEGGGTFATLCFGAAAASSFITLGLRDKNYRALTGRAVIGGTVLGIINYASLHFLVEALGPAGLPASTVFPLMNIIAILIGSMAAMLLFRERLSRSQWIGIVLCVGALVLLTYGPA